MVKLTILALLAEVEPRPNFALPFPLEDVVNELSSTYPRLVVTTHLHDDTLVGNRESLHNILYRLGHIKVFVDHGPEGERLEYEMITESATRVLQRIFKSLDTYGKDTF